MRDLSIEFALQLRKAEIEERIAEIERSRTRPGDLAAYDLGVLCRLREERYWLSTFINFLAEGGAE